MTDHWRNFPEMCLKCFRLIMYELFTTWTLQDDMKTLEGDYERTSEELELLEEELKEGEVRRVALTDELDELKEELLKLKVVMIKVVITLYLNSLTLFQAFMFLPIIGAITSYTYICLQESDYKHRHCLYLLSYKLIVDK